MDLLLFTAGLCIVISLALAWTASLALYLEVPFLVKVFPAAFQLVRAHIDYLLMAMLLAATVFMAEHQGVDIPTFVRWMAVIGALWNPIGFIVLATDVQKRRPNPGAETWATIIGFIPATIGFGYSAVLIAVESA